MANNSYSGGTTMTCVLLLEKHCIKNRRCLSQYYTVTVQTAPKLIEQRNDALSLEGPEQTSVER